MVETQSGPLPSAHNADCHLPSSNGFVADLLELLGVLLEVFVGGDVGNRLEVLILLVFGGLSFDIDVLI